MTDDEESLPWIVFGCGATIETAFLPQRLFDLRCDFRVRLGAALSTRAQDFVTPLAMRAVCGGRPIYHRDDQLDEDGTPLHLVARDADLLVLYPATPRIIAECALGIISCPVTRCFAFAKKDRVLLAPTLHPAMDRRLYEPHLHRVSSLGCDIVDNAEHFVSWHDVKTRVVEKLSLRRRSQTPSIATLFVD